MAEGKDGDVNLPVVSFLGSKGLQFGPIEIGGDNETYEKGKKLGGFLANVLFSPIYLGLASHTVSAAIRRFRINETQRQATLFNQKEPRGRFFNNREHNFTEYLKMVLPDVYNDVENIVKLGIRRETEYKKERFQLEEELLLAKKANDQIRVRALEFEIGRVDFVFRNFAILTAPPATELEKLNASYLTSKQNIDDLLAGRTALPPAIVASLPVDINQLIALSFNGLKRREKVTDILDASTNFDADLDSIQEKIRLIRKKQIIQTTDIEEIVALRIKELELNRNIA